ncbi:MAG: hypothetical protein ACXWDO_06485 [Bacteroidia bacterium]
MYTPQRNTPYDNGNRIRALGGKVLGYISIGFGTVSILIGLVPFVNFLAILAGVIGIVVGIIGLRQSMKVQNTAIFSIAGIILALIGVVISLAVNDYVIDKISDDDSDNRPAIENTGSDY